jgi:hypothetical protein
MLTNLNCIILELLQIINGTCQRFPGMRQIVGEMIVWYEQTHISYSETLKQLLSYNACFLR